MHMDVNAKTNSEMNFQIIIAIKFSSFFFSFCLGSLFRSLLLLRFLLLLLRLLGSFFSYSVVIDHNHSGVDHLGAVLDNLLDETLLCELNKSSSGKRAANLEPFTDDGRSDKFVGWDLLVQFVVGGLIKEYKIVKLVPRLSLGPLLLFGLTAAATGSFLGGSLGGFGVLFGVLLSPHGLLLLKCYTQAI